MNYVEKDCTLMFEGRVFTAGGAVVTPDQAIAYIGSRRRDGLYDVADWHGVWLGTARVTATWCTPRSHVSSTMHQYCVTIDGVRYTGHSAGTGMLFRGRRVRGDSHA